MERDCSSGPLLDCSAVGHSQPQMMLEKIAAYGFTGFMVHCFLLLNLLQVPGLPRLSQKIMPFRNELRLFQLLVAGLTPPKEATETVKERSNILVEIMAKTYYGLRTRAKKFQKYGQVESIVMNMQNTPIYYVKYRN